MSLSRTRMHTCARPFAHSLKCILLFAGDVHTICPFDFSTELDEVRAFMVSYSPSRVKLVSLMPVQLYTYVQTSRKYIAQNVEKACASIYIEQTLFR